MVSHHVNNPMMGIAWQRCSRLCVFSWFFPIHLTYSSLITQDLPKCMAVCLKFTILVKNSTIHIPCSLAPSLARMGIIRTSSLRSVLKLKRRTSETCTTRHSPDRILSGDVIHNKLAGGVHYTILYICSGRAKTQAYSSSLTSYNRQTRLPIAAN